MTKLTIYRDTRAPEQYSSWIAIAEGVEGDDEGRARLWRRFDDGTSVSKTVRKISPPAAGWRDESNYLHVTEEGVEIWDQDGRISTAPRIFGALLSGSADTASFSRVINGGRGDLWQAWFSYLALKGYHTPEGGKK